MTTARRIGLYLGLGVVAIALLGAALLLGLMASAPEPRADTEWILEQPMPAAKGELATAVVERAVPCPQPPCAPTSRIAVVSGIAGLGRVLDSVYFFEPESRRWERGPPLPAARHHGAAVGLGGALYFTGGAASLTGPWQPEADFWRLAPDAEQWQTLPPMPEPRWGHRLVTHAGRLYVIGGQGPGADVLIHDPETGWRRGAALPEPRDHLSAVVVDDEIWAIGGRAPASLARVDIYDIASDSWREGPALPEPTSGAAEGVIDGRILIFGGEEPTRGGGIIDAHWQFDTRAAHAGWRPAPAPALAVHGADGTVYDGRMVIVGGASRHGALSVTAWTDLMQTLPVRGR